MTVVGLPGPRPPPLCAAWQCVSVFFRKKPIPLPSLLCCFFKGIMFGHQLASMPYIWLGLAHARAWLLLRPKRALPACPASTLAGVQPLRKARPQTLVTFYSLSFCSACGPALAMPQVAQAVAAALLPDDAWCGGNRLASVYMRIYVPCVPVHHACLV